MSSCRGGSSVGEGRMYEKRMSRRGDRFLIGFEERAVIAQKTAVEVKNMKNVEEHIPCTIS